MMKWVRGKTKRLAKGYSLTVYTAEGTSAIIAMHTYALEARSLVLFSTIYNGQIDGGFVTFRGAKKYIEHKLKPPRVLTLDEAIGAEVNEDEPCYFEAKNEKLIYLANAERADDYAFAKIDIWGRLHRKYLLSEYGRYWRMWSAKPTEEQRAAAKWEE